MEINPSKSRFLKNGVEDGIFSQIGDLFPFKVGARLWHFEGFKYLGYMLKPNNYHRKDWMWLVKKVDHKIGSWCYRWLSS